MIRLVNPCVEYKKQFQDMVREYKKYDDIESEGWIEFYQDGLRDFEGYLQELRDHSEGKNLPEDWVTCHTFWVVDNHKNVVGVSRVRMNLDNEYLQQCGGHIGYEIVPSKQKKGYGTETLRLTLEKAKELGLDKVLITCNFDNIGSIKVIENNGGIFENEVWDDFDMIMVRRYWIDI